MDILKTLAEEFKIKEEQVKETVALIDENGNTVGNLLHFMFASRQEMIDGETFTLDSSELPKGNFGLRIVAAVGDIIRID